MKPIGRNLNYEEIIGFGSIEDLNSYLAQKITDKFGRESIDNFDKFLDKIFKINISSVFSEWAKLRENYYRRNLVVPNQYLINKDYIDKIDGYELEDIDKELNVDYLYIKRCHGHL